MQTKNNFDMKNLMLICFVLIGCKSETITENQTEPLPNFSNTIFYKDFDIFKMQGIDELHKDNLTYPYVEVKLQKYIIRLIPHTCPRNSVDEIIFFYDNGIWKREIQSEFDLIDDDVVSEEGFINYQFIYNDTIADYTYHFNEDGNLEDLSVRLFTIKSAVHYSNISPKKFDYKLGKILESKNLEKDNIFTNTIYEVNDSTFIATEFSYFPEVPIDTMTISSGVLYHQINTNYLEEFGDGEIELPKKFSYFWLIYNHSNCFKFYKIKEKERRIKK